MLSLGYIECGGCLIVLDDQLTPIWQTYRLGSVADGMRSRPPWLRGWVATFWSLLSLWTTSAQGWRLVEVLRQHPS